MIKNTPTIITQRLILRKFTEFDLIAVLDIFSDEDANKFLPWLPIKNIDDAKVFLREKFLTYYEEDFAYRYAICLKDNDTPIGYVWLANDASCDFGYGLKKDFWHKGIASEASMAVVTTIKTAGYDYITATHDVNNPRSGEVMKKLGMRYKYSYTEQWQPKNLTVTFRMYQLNFSQNDGGVYLGYWNKYADHFVEEIL